MGILTKALTMMRAKTPTGGGVGPGLGWLGGWAGGWGGGFGTAFPLSHGYVHEPFTGAWQRNAECFGPNGIFSAVYACVQIISGDISKLPPVIRRIHDDGSKSDFPNHPAARVLWRPNDYQTHVDFWGQFVATLLLYGNVYALLVRDARNVISQMHILDSRCVETLIAEDGSVWYRVTQERVIERIGREYIPARDIMHHRLLTMSHPLVGVTPIFAASSSAATGQLIQQQSLSFFRNQSRASGVLKVPGNISKAELTRLKSEWEQNFKGGAVGSTAVLTGGLEWQALSLTAEDAQLIEQLRFTIEDVARCFRVPGYMIADASKMSYKNSEQLWRSYYAQTLQYHLEAIESRIDATFDLANDVAVEFDLTSLLRMELDVRMSAYQTGISSGVLTINEARRQESLPPVNGGDEPLVQVQYVPLSRAGQTMGAAPTEPADTDTDEDADANADDAADEDEDADGDELEEAAPDGARLAELARAALGKAFAPVGGLL